MKGRGKLVLIVMLGLMAIFNGCSKKETFTEKSFTGKWKSSRISTPIYLYENGEWKVLTEDGGTLQQGVWQYKDNRILWSVKIDDRMGHEANPVLSADPQEFKLREGDGSVTTFSRLE